MDCYTNMQKDKFPLVIWLIKIAELVLHVKKDDKMETERYQQKSVQKKTYSSKKIRILQQKRFQIRLA